MTTKKLLVAAGVLVTVGLGLLLTPLLFLTVLSAGSSASCAPATQVDYTGPGVGGLSASQMQRAAAVVTQGRQMGIPDQGIVVALATASQESGFRVYANDGQGGDLALRTNAVSPRRWTCPTTRSGPTTAR